MHLEDTVPDHEFIACLRAAIEQYLSAVDEWESKYQKYYRLPGYAARVTSEMEAEQRQYRERRRELEEMLPRARRLCLKHRLRDPFGGLLRISLGRYAPQHRVDSAIGRNERNEVTKCLVELSGACQEWELAGTSNTANDGATPESDKGSLLKRLVDYFY